MLQKTGVLERFTNLPKGIDSSMNKDFDPDGADVSGGEVQKIAILKAYIKMLLSLFWMSLPPHLIHYQRRRYMQILIVLLVRKRQCIFRTDYPVANFIIKLLF